MASPSKTFYYGVAGFRRFLGVGEGRKRAEFDASWAWWYLSNKQKKVLAQQRRGGRFGGMPGKAPYYWLQEFGDEKAHVRPQAFMAFAVAALLQQQGGIIGRYLHAR